MILQSFRVRKFRNVVDSGDIKVDDAVTCLVGKNEAGKSGLLEALYLLNPAYEQTFKLEDQYPRWLLTKDRKAGDIQETQPINAIFELSCEEFAELENTYGGGILTSRTFTLGRQYSDQLTVDVSLNEEAYVDLQKAALPGSIKAPLDKVSTLVDLHDAVSKQVQEDDDSENAKKILGDTYKSRGELWDAITDDIIALVPTFFRFSSYSTLPGRIDLRKIGTAKEKPAESDMQTARALLSLAGTDLKQIQSDDYDLRKAELEAVQIDLTQQVFEYWKQNPNLRVHIDVDKVTESNNQGHTAVARFLDIRLEDGRTGYSNNFCQRSSGFQWFFSFLAGFSEFESKGNTIVLLDEPALTLHGKAQGDFLRFINERLAPSSPVIYTTHSPFMVEADQLQRTRIVEDLGPPRGVIVSADVLAIDPDSLFPLQAALGYDIAQSLFIGPNNLIVEGTSDFIYITIMSLLCKKNNKTELDSRWRILPAGSASNIPTFVSLIGRHLDITVLADSDTQGLQRITAMASQNLLKDTRLILANRITETKNADIEDLFDPKDYLGIYNLTFGLKTQLKELPQGDRIVKRIEAKNGQYNHGQVAETFLRRHPELSLSDVTIENFAKLHSAINTTMSS
ncbi:AAA family ATPase [Lysobacter sp. F60174L2]|uniref:AAA family ATPase n=1 Tax=Lysobacter sp. F60174L2 TaxID=3459295 RepID=UPI00403E091E